MMVYTKIRNNYNEIEDVPAVLWDYIFSVVLPNKLKRSQSKFTLRGDNLTLLVEHLNSRTEDSPFHRTCHYLALYLTINDGADYYVINKEK